MVFIEEYKCSVGKMLKVKFWIDRFKKFNYEIFIFLFFLIERVNKFLVIFFKFLLCFKDVFFLLRIVNLYDVEDKFFGYYLLFLLIFFSESN